MALAHGINRVSPVTETQTNRGGIVLGFLTGAGLCVIHAVIVLASSDMSFVFRGLRFFGLIQFIYMIPVFLFLQRRRPGMASGLAIAASLVALANIALITMN
jgi:hypothetical protein